MRGKRLTMLGLSALLTLSTLAFAAPAVSADTGRNTHPNPIVAAVIAQEDMAAVSNYNKKAIVAVELLRDLRHWQRDHGTPRFIVATSCRADYLVWFNRTQGWSRAAFRYYSGKASQWESLPKDLRAQRRITQWLIYDRATDRQADAQDDLVDCIVDGIPRRLGRLLA
jgi:hypothetical protein